jgi:hypothetical protein
MDRSLRVAGWAGLLFSLLSLVVIPLVGGVFPPPLGSSGAELAQFYRDHRIGFLVGNWLGIAAFVPGFVQLAVLTSQVKRAEGERTYLSTLVLSTGIFAYAVFACSLAVFQALPFLIEARQELAVEAMGTLGAVWFALDGLVAMPFVLAVGWATTSTRVLPGWVAVASWPVALIGLGMSFGAITATPKWLAGGGVATGAGFVAVFLWTGAMSVAQLRAARR